jgi:hypothetical protein
MIEQSRKIGTSDFLYYQDNLFFIGVDGQISIFKGFNPDMPIISSSKPVRKVCLKASLGHTMIQPSSSR